MASGRAPTSLILTLSVAALACTPTEAPPSEAKPGPSKATPSKAEPSEAEPSKLEPAAKPEPEPTPAPTKLTFERIIELDRHSEGWSIAMPIALKPEQEDLIGAGAIDLAAVGIANPFPSGPVTLITPTETIERTITQYEVVRTLNDDLLVAALGPKSEADAKAEHNGIAILGAVKPVAGAKLELVAAAPASAEIVAKLVTEFEAELTKLVEGFQPIGYGKLETKPLTPNVACVTLSRPKLPPGYDAIMTVRCGLPEVDRPKLAGTFLLKTDGTGEPLGEQRWAIEHGGSTIHQAIDLDGDGIDELVVHDDGYEYWAVRFLGWDGVRYVPIGAASAD